MPAPDIEAAAAAWLIRIEGDDSPATRALFEAWLRTDARHRAAFARLKNVWRHADVLKKLRPLDGAVDAKILDSFGLGRPIDQEPARQKTRLWQAIAGGLLVAAVGTAGWIGVERSHWKVYRTDLGGFQRVSMQDGSTALLNTSSEIRVRLTGKERRVVLVRGEAEFTVAHDTSRPFDVEAGDTKVRAVGTAFALRLRDSEQGPAGHAGGGKQVDVIVTEGQVAIDPLDVGAEINLPESASPPPVSTVGAGETAIVEAHKLHVTQIDDNDITRRLAWTRGQLQFDRTTLAEAVAEFNRYNHRQLVIGDPGIATFQIGGAFDNTDLTSFVAALQKFGIRAVAGAGQVRNSDLGEIRLVSAGQSQ